MWDNKHIVVKFKKQDAIPKLIFTFFKLWLTVVLVKMSNEY